MQSHPQSGSLLLLLDHRPSLFQTVTYGFCCEALGREWRTTPLPAARNFG